MKLKYYFKFYKYIYRAILIYLGFLSSALAFYLIFKNLNSNKILNTIILVCYILAFIIGTSYFIKNFIDVYRFMPIHFRDFYKVSAIINRERKQNPNFVLDKVFLYSLGDTLCGREVIKAIAEEYNIEL